MSKKTALYRHFDDEGRLLYVGISLDPLKRTAQHMQQAYWADRIRGISIEWLPTRGMAIDAEERAIAEEEPAYNIVGRAFTCKWEPELSDDEEMAMLEAAIARKKC